MHVLRDVVVWIHLVGFAVTFGAWAAAALSSERRTSRIMEYGLLISLLTGVVLALPWPADVHPNYVKIAIKLTILVVVGGLLGMSNARQRRTGEPTAPVAFWSVGALILSAAALGVIWH
ncbi:hypothetical protein [Gordonia soli]|uniref:Fe-S protein n=1 Tax=Gordonia soli NBRC 108243 TaxID=1223545 RepID=M0QRQ1_9ACTN|nr:hypothetical protein [Gordonia soli]GAC70237.1 hypothetical protein GS4_33_00520 [Gordonia soli NBRC 108243]